MTSYPDLFADLAAPFEPHEVKIRPQGGRQLKYVTARTVMNRLDEAIGPENWWDEYEQSERSVVCKLTLRLPDGQILTKYDVGGHAGMQDEGDDEKSGFSDAFKRAAAKFGVGRYLYGDGAPRYQRRPVIVEAQNGVAAESQPIAAPAPVVSEAAPSPSGRASRSNGHANGHANEHANGNGVNGHHGNGNGNGHHANGHSAAPNNLDTNRIPKTGKALFGWAKDVDQQRSDANMVKFLTSWGKSQEFPIRMVDWDSEMVGQAHAEACRRLHSVASARAEEREMAMVN